MTHHLQHILFRLDEPLTKQERIVGWPAYLCDGPLFTRDLDLLGVPGVVVSVDPETAEEMGAFEEDALSAEDAIAASTEEDRHLDALWSGSLAPAKGKKGRARSRNANGPPRRLLARQKGRPPGLRPVHRPSVDPTPYQDREAFGSAAASHCRKELQAAWPFVDLERLTGLVSEIMGRGTTTSASSERTDEGAAAATLASRYSAPTPIGSPLTFSRLCDAAFLQAVPRSVSRREALVRAVEYLWTRMGIEWQWTAPPITNSRPLAIASIAAGEQVLLRGPSPWLVSEAIVAEQRAVAHTMKKIAAERLFATGSSTQPTR